MEIESDHIVQLIAGQAATAQAVQDLKGSVEKGFKFMTDQHSKLDDRVGSIEKRVWYQTGVGAALGVAAGWFGFHLGK